MTDRVRTRNILDLLRDAAHHHTVAADHTARRDDLIHEAWRVGATTRQIVQHVPITTRAVEDALAGRGVETIDGPLGGGV